MSPVSTIAVALAIGISSLATDALVGIGGTKETTSFGIVGPIKT
jgi:uncharacterized membrane protein